VVDVDRNRVQRKFEDALERGICVVNRTLRLVEILTHLSKGKTAIVLVNSQSLECLMHFMHEARLDTAIFGVILGRV